MIILCSSTRFKNNLEEQFSNKKKRKKKEQFRRKLFMFTCNIHFLLFLVFLRRKMCGNGAIPDRYVKKYILNIPITLNDISYTY